MHKTTAIYNPDMFCLYGGDFDGLQLGKKTQP